MAVKLGDYVYTQFLITYERLSNSVKQNTTLPSRTNYSRHERNGIKS